MWGQAVLVVLVAAVVGQQQPHLGGAINLFSRYGYLSISMRVVPRNDTNPSWIFREPTVDIFRSGCDFLYEWRLNMALHSAETLAVRPCEFMCQCCTNFNTSNRIMLSNL